jgi:1-acyl-sn-glycerol-3-phosphate acyltransferase
MHLSHDSLDVVPLGINEPLHLATKLIAKCFFSLLYTLDIEGDAYLPRKSGFILLPKHQRWQDIPLIALATPRPLYYIAKHELFKNPVSDWFMRSLGGIPLNREKPLKSRVELRTMVRHLTSGEGVVVFPEGTYYRGKMGPGKGGIVRLIISRFSLPLIPVGIRYAHEGLRSRVSIRFGRALFPEKTRQPSHILNRVMTNIATLSGLM